MTQKVNFPTFLVAVAILACLLYGVYRYTGRAPQQEPGADQIPPRIPGQDKPLPPPPGMHMPGTLKK